MRIGKGMGSAEGDSQFGQGQYLLLVGTDRRDGAVLGRDTEALFQRRAGVGLHLGAADGGEGTPEDGSIVLGISLVENELRVGGQIAVHHLPQEIEPRPQRIQKSDQEEQACHHTDVGGELASLPLGGE